VLQQIDAVASKYPLSRFTASIHNMQHHAAPMTCLFFALIMLAMRRLWLHRWRRKPTGLFVVRAVPALTILLMLLRVGVFRLHVRPRFEW
jgi:hypothetical protein